jgi:hypothetical protein
LALGKPALDRGFLTVTERDVHDMGEAKRRMVSLPEKESTHDDVRAVLFDAVENGEPGEVLVYVTVPRIGAYYYTPDSETWDLLNRRLTVGQKMEIVGNAPHQMLHMLVRANRHNEPFNDDDMKLCAAVMADEILRVQRVRRDQAALVTISIGPNGSYQGMIAKQKTAA